MIVGNVSGLLPGTTFGSYEIQSLLANGGMARVYRGFDHKLQRLVAIKVMTEATSHPDEIARFQQEARFIAQLHHPNIVQVYDFGEASGSAYMVQELLPGPTLEQEIANHHARSISFTRDETLAILRQLAAALDTAHAAGIIHRDIKPSNALYNGHGQLILTDFGIARLTQQQTIHTQAGVVIGTPDYLSPEQAQGLPASIASDIYSLGIVAYELIAGRRPFAAATPLGVLLGHVQQEPPSLRTELPPPAESVVMQALAKEPGRRFASAGAFVAALEQTWVNVHNPAIHSLPTVAWKSPGPANASASTVAAQANAPTTPNAPAPPVLQPTAPALNASRPRWLLPMLGLVLLAVLLGIAFIRRGSGERQSGTASTAVPIAALATSAPQSTVVVEPTDAPTPTIAPPTSTPMLSQPAAPLEQLRVLLQENAASGQIENGRDVLKHFDDFAAALNSGDTKRAGDRLDDLRSALEDGDITPGVRDQALGLVDQIAQAYGIALDEPSDPDKGKGKGKGKD